MASPESLRQQWTDGVNRALDAETAYRAWDARLQEARTNRDAWRAEWTLIQEQLGRVQQAMIADNVRVK